MSERGKKRVVCRVVVLALLAVPALAEPQLSLNSAGAVLGGTATLKLRLDNAGELCDGVNAKIALPMGVALLDVTAADLVSDEFAVVFHAPDENPDNVYTFAAYSTSNTFAADSGLLVLLNIQISDDPAAVGLDTTPILQTDVPILASGLSAREGAISLAHTKTSGRLVLMTEAAPVLDVAPLTLEAGVAGEDVSFVVSNVGFLDMPWSASESADWISIVDGTSGAGAGIVTVRCEANSATTPRTAEIVVDAGDVFGSPITVSIVQHGDTTPELSVTPMVHEVPATSGLCSLEVANARSGSMPWTAQVVSGFEWLSIVSGTEGTDSGTIALSHYPNTTSSNRTAQVEVRAPGALGSPALVTIAQLTSSGPLLVVTPPERTVAASAGDTEFHVRNAGGGVMSWTAAVVEGAAWLTIEAGTAGTQDGTIQVAVDRNPMLEERIGAIRVTADGAAESPVDVIVTQQGRQLLMLTSPNGGEQFARGEAIAIDWTSDSETTEAVSLVLVKGGGVHSTIAITADNSGTHAWTVPRAIEPGNDYQIQIIDTENAAIHDESDSSFSIACPPDAPQQVSASDDRTDMVVVAWSAVDSAEQYRVFRRSSDGGDEPIAVGTTAETSFADTTALAPEKSGAGCHPQTTIHHYMYSVSAVNLCAESEPSTEDEGCRVKAAAKEVYERVLPAGPVADGVILIAPDAALAVRVRSDAPIDAASVTAIIASDTVFADTVEWLSIDARDGWAVYRPDEEWPANEIVTMTVRAANSAGEPLGPFKYKFQVGDTLRDAEEVWQPGYDDFDASAIDVAKEANDRVQLAIVDAGDASGPVFAVGPMEPFAVPQRVWLPVPESMDADAVRVEFYHHDGEASGWYPGAHVDGWLADGDELVLEFEQRQYVGILVQHGGLVRLVADDGNANAASMDGPRQASTDYVLFTAILMALGVAGQSARKTRRHPQSPRL